MTRDDIIRMAREAGFKIEWQEPYYEGEEPLWFVRMDRGETLTRFAALVAEAEREACAKLAGEFAQKWWSIHCASNKHMETTRKAHDDFCALQASIRARGTK